MLAEVMKFVKGNTTDNNDAIGSLVDQPRSYLLEDFGEISYGPPYYRVRVNGKFSWNLIVGEPRLEIHEKDTVILQKWYTVYAEDGPLTALVALNWNTGRKKVITRKIHGWWTPHIYRDGKIHAEAEYWVSKHGKNEKIVEDVVIDF